MPMERAGSVDRVTGARLPFSAAAGNSSSLDRPAPRRAQRRLLAPPLRPGAARSPGLGRCHPGRGPAGPGRARRRPGATSPSGRPSSWSPPPGSMPTGWRTTWPASSPTRRRRRVPAPAVVGAVGGPVAVLPAWETLPFERVSPEVETMGRRLALLWGLRHPVDDPHVRPAPGDRGADPRPPPDGSGRRRRTPPTTGAPRAGALGGRAARRLVGAGYRREHQVEHRGEIAVRGGIIDVFPSTADVPVRIDLWGDEVDRLTAFAVNDQRSQTDLDAAVFFGCRELIPTADVRAAAAVAGPQPALGGQPVGAAGRGRDLRRHGVVAALRPPGGGPAAGPAPARGPRWCSSSPGGSVTGPSSCSTRRRRWPRRWP